MVKRCKRTTEATRIAYIHSGDDKDTRLSQQTLTNSGGFRGTGGGGGQSNPR